MGGCFSSRSEGGDAECLLSDAAASVVSIGGELRRYSLPGTVADVLESTNGVFLCDSDSLSFDEYVPRLKPDESLRRDSIYFVLPVSRLRYRVSVSDLADLAVKASVAIDRFNRKSPISPALFGVVNKGVLVSDSKAIDDNYGVRSSFKRSPTGKSVSKLARSSSRRAKSAARSVKVRLSTIYEGSVLLFD